MLWAFLVTWKLSFWITDPCPDAGKLNEYGNPLRGLNYGCLVNHGHCIYEDKSKEFATLNEAEDFVRNAPSNTQDFVIKEIKEQ